MKSGNGDMSLGKTLALGASALTFVGTIIGGWVFLDGHIVQEVEEGIATDAALSERFLKLEQDIATLRLDVEAMDTILATRHSLRSEVDQLKTGSPAIEPPARLCEGLQPGQDCDLTLSPLTPTSVLDGGVRITWPAGNEKGTVTVRVDGRRRVQTLRTDGTIKHGDASYRLWVLTIDDRAVEPTITLRMRRIK